MKAMASILRTGIAAVFTVVSLSAAANADFWSSVGISSDVPAFDKAAGKPWLDQLDAKKAFPKKPFTPKPSLLAPYSKASVGPDFAFAMAQSHMSFASAPQAQAYCQQIIDKLLATWSGPKPVIRAIITSDASYGALANLTGDIFIHIGTFNANPAKGVQSEDELALLLAHEISHVVLLHVQQKQSLSDFTDMLNTAASLYTTATLFSNARQNPSAEQQKEQTQALLQSMVGGLGASMLVGDVFAPSWSRGDEGEADLMGYDLARHAGYLIGPNEIDSFLHKQADDVALRSQRVERLKNASMLMYLHATAKNGQTTIGKVSLMAVGGALFDGLMTKIASSKSHPDVNERVTALNAYMTSSYPELPTRGPDGRILSRQVKALNAVTHLPLIVSMVDSANTGERVSEMMTSYAIAAGEQQKATDEAAQKKTQDTAKAATPPPPALPPFPSACAGNMVQIYPKPGEAVMIKANFPMDNTPLTWRIRGDWQLVSPPCKARVSADYLRYVNSGQADPDNLHKALDALYGTKEGAQLPTIYDRYVAIYGTDLDFPDLAVAVALMRKDIVTAETKAADCYAYDHHRLYPACARLLGYDPANKATPAKTEEGKKAFLKKSLDGSLNELFGGAASSIYSSK